MKITEQRIMILLQTITLLMLLALISTGSLTGAAGTAIKSSVVKLSASDIDTLGANLKVIFSWTDPQDFNYSLMQQSRDILNNSIAIGQSETAYYQGRITAYDEAMQRLTDNYALYKPLSAEIQEVRDDLADIEAQLNALPPADSDNTVVVSAQRNQLNQQKIVLLAHLMNLQTQARPIIVDIRAGKLTLQAITNEFVVKAGYTAFNNPLPDITTYEDTVTANPVD